MRESENNLVAEIEKNGFAHLASVLDENSIVNLSQECKKILYSEFIQNEDAYSQFPDTQKFYRNNITKKTAYNTLNRNVIGVSPTVDSIIEKVLTNKDVKEILVAFCGQDYKILTCAIRQASSLSTFVGLHQDAPYQFSIAVFLNDISERSATTVFYNETHKIPFKFDSKFEAFDTKIFNKKLTPAIGKKGDIVFFMNKVLHGMKTGENNSDDSAVILMCFHPCGYPYPPWRLPIQSSYSEKFISSLGPELARLFRYDKSDYSVNNGEIILKLKSQNEHKIIDQYVDLKVKSLSDIILVGYWYVTYLFFFTLRVIRKLFRINKK